MNEKKFSPGAEESLRLSQEAAGELGHGYVGTEHLLLGLIREDQGTAHDVLLESGLTDDMIVQIIKRSVGAGLPGGNPAQGLTPRARRVVEIAVEDAVRGGSPYVGTEHLLAGLLREGNNMAVRILRTAGVDARPLYAALMQKLNQRPQSRQPAAPRDDRGPASGGGAGGKTLREFTRDLTRHQADWSGYYNCRHQVSVIQLSNAIAGLPPDALTLLCQPCFFSSSPEAVPF